MARDVIKDKELIFSGKKPGMIGTKRACVTITIHRNVITPYPKINYDTLDIITEPYYTVSISGEIGRDEWGQIVMSYTVDDVSDGLKPIWMIWDVYHLNGYVAGTKTQMDALKSPDFSYTDNWYTSACEYLRGIYLYEDRGYAFGSSWLVKVISDDDIEYLKELFR